MLRNVAATGQAQNKVGQRDNTLSDTTLLQYNLWSGVTKQRLNRHHIRGLGMQKACF